MLPLPPPLLLLLLLHSEGDAVPAVCDPTPGGHQWSDTPPPLLRYPSSSSSSSCSSTSYPPLVSYLYVFRLLVFWLNFIFVFIT